MVDHVLPLGGMGFQYRSNPRRGIPGDTVPINGIMARKALNPKGFQGLEFPPGRCCSLHHPSAGGGPEKKGGASLARAPALQSTCIAPAVAPEHDQHSAARAGWPDWGSDKCSNLQSKHGKPAIVCVFQPTLSATDGPRNRHYLQLNLQSAGSDLQSSPANRHYLQPKRRPETHQTVPNLDVVF